MGYKKIADDIYSVGVMNPSLRIFDIVMYAKYGTTYNSYIIKGSEKTALVETVHADFFDEWEENIKPICKLSDIDYLIVNHTEPDHTGSIARLLEINPTIKVFGTAAAKKYTADITNASIDFTVCRAGDSLSLGDRELEFCPAPFLHWPDSMFTFDKKTRTAFTCDFLGCHFCEPQGTDKYIRNRAEYDAAFRYYFDGIFGPFKKYVLEGLEKLSALNPATVCPSHGPVLTESVGEQMAKYKEYASEQQSDKFMAIFYASCYGYTEMMAKAAAKGAADAGVTAKLIDIVTEKPEIATAALNSAAAVMVGSTTINRDAPGAVWQLLSTADAVISPRPAGAFGSYGWSGEAVQMIKDRLTGLHFKFQGDGKRFVFKPTDENLKEIEEYAAEICKLIK